MTFSKKVFIEKNSEFLFQLLEDFLYTEINQETYTIIYDFLRLSNFRTGEFEGNQYLIKKEDTTDVVIIDYVSEEFKNDFSQTRFKISVNELLELMESRIR